MFLFNSLNIKTRKIPAPFRSTESMWGFPILLLTSYLLHLLILILPLILLRQLQQLLKLPQPWLFQLPRIHQLPIRFHPLCSVVKYVGM